MMATSAAAEIGRTLAEAEVKEKSPLQQHRVAIQRDHGPMSR